MAAGSQKFCLKWNDFKGIVTSAFDNLRHDEELVDITLCCEGKQIKAHRMMLSACSPYFKDVLKENPCQHPVFFMRDVSYSDMAAVIEFVYTGEVNVSQSNLSSFLKTAEMLQVKGLTDEDKANSLPHPEAAQSPVHPSTLPSPSSARAGQVRAKRPVSSVANPAASADTSPSFSPAAKRSRADTAPRLLAPAAATYAPQTTETSHDLAASRPAVLPPSDPPPLPPPPPAPPAAVDQPPPPPPPPESVHYDPGTVKTEDGESLDASLDTETDYAGLLDFTSAEQALAAASEEGSGSQGGMFFREESSAGRPFLGGGGSGGWSGADSLDRRTCGVCGKVFQHRESLYHHMHMHSGATTCPRCRRVFSTRKNLRMHLVHAAKCKATNADPPGNE